MKAKFYNPVTDEIEVTDTDFLENDSGNEWSEEMLINYITDACPGAQNIEII